MLFIIEFFFAIASHQFFKNDWISLNHGLFFGKNILYKSTFSNFENKIVLFLVNFEFFS